MYLRGGPKEPPWVGEKKLACVSNSSGVMKAGNGLILFAVTQARAAPGGQKEVTTLIRNGSELKFQGRFDLDVCKNVLQYAHSISCFPHGFRARLAGLHQHFLISTFLPF